MLAADRGTLDAHTAHYSLAARGGGSCPTDEGIRTFPRTAPGEDIIADRLGGQNRWPLTGVRFRAVPRRDRRLLGASGPRASPGLGPDRARREGCFPRRGAKLPVDFSSISSMSIEPHSGIAGRKPAAQRQLPGGAGKTCQCPVQSAPMGKHRVACDGAV